MVNCNFSFIPPTLMVTHTISKSRLSLMEVIERTRLHAALIGSLRFRYGNFDLLYLGEWRNIFQGRAKILFRLKLICKF